MFFETYPNTFSPENVPVFTAQQIVEMTSVTVIISKDMVQSSDCSKIIPQLEEFRKAGCAGFRKLELVFKGYDLDEHEAFQIPEIRAYIKKLFALYPELLLYFPSGTDYYYASCMLDVDYVRNGNCRTVTVRPTASNSAKMQEIDYACRRFKDRMCDDYCHLHDSYHPVGNTDKHNC